MHEPIDGDHGDAQQRYTHIAVLYERYQSAEECTVRPCALDEAECIEGQHKQTEQTIGHTETTSTEDKEKHS